MNAPLRTLRIFALLAGPALALLTVTWLTQLNPKAVPVSRAAESGNVATPTNPAGRPTTAHPAADGAGPGSATSAVPTAVAPHQAGMVVGIDPETGKIGPPTAEQRAELDQIAASQNALLSRSAVGLTEEHRADGTVHVNLQGRFQEYATVRIGPDGKKTFGCVEDTSGISKSATEAVTSAQPAAAAPVSAAPAAEGR